jgi:hypothetical protein
VFQLGVDGRSNEHVSLTSEGPFVAAVWASTDSGGTTDIYAAVSEDEGGAFTAPVRVNAIAGDARANGEQPPRVTLIPRAGTSPEIVVLWIARRSTGTVLLTATSRDGGRSFGPSSLMPGTDTAGNRGWHAIDGDHTGNADAVWLDHRRVVSGGSGAGAHAHHGAAASTSPASAATEVDTVAMAQMSDLYFASGADGAQPRALTSGVCYCCKTAMVHGADGTIYVAWRHVYAGNMRDIAFTMSRDGGRTFSTPVRVSEDGWSIAGCPDDGPSMSVDARGRVHVVWPTVATENGKTMKSLFHAMTEDGQTFSPRVRLSHRDDAHHPQVTATANGVVVVWDEFVGDELHPVHASGVIDASGAMTFDGTSVVSPRPGRYPAVVATAGHVITASIAGRGPASRIQVERR